MKKLIFLTLFIFSNALLAGCSNEEPIVFEAVTVPGFEIDVETLLRVHSSQFDNYGNLVDGAHVNDDELTELLAELEIALPEIPANEITFAIELISYEFYLRDDEFDEEIEDNRTLPNPIESSVTITEAGVVRFPSITFSNAGVFIFKITQLIDVSEHIDDHDQENHRWLLDESNMLIIVRINEDLETETLVADVENVNDFAFVNVLEYDISEEVRVGVLRHREILFDRVCEEPDLTPILNALERYGDGVAIYFENLNTDCIFRHNADKNFFAASVTKAPFALWIYSKAEDGYVCMDMTMYFTQDVLRLRSGIIRHDYNVGYAFSLRRILGLNLYESDNTATEMLRREFGYQGYADFIDGLGGTRDFAVDIWNSRITADEAGFFAREIFAYIESDQRYSDELRQNLLNNQFPFIVSDYPVASKTGWHEEFGAWHDMAIVYAPSPYILVILSSDRTGTAADHAAYEYISLAFQEFNRLNFEPFADME